MAKNSTPIHRRNFILHLQEPSQMQPNRIEVQGRNEVEAPAFAPSSSHEKVEERRIRIQLDNVGCRLFERLGKDAAIQTMRRCFGVRSGPGAAGRKGGDGSALGCGDRVFVEAAPPPERIF